MVDLKKLQKEIYQNKVDKGFNVTDVNKEFCLTYGEVAEAYEAWRKRKMIQAKNQLMLQYIYQDYQKYQEQIQKMKYRKKFIKTQKENIQLLMVLIQEQKNLMKNQKDNLSNKIVKL